MYKSLMGEKVNVIVSSRANQLLEYVGTLSSESEHSIELTSVNMSYLMPTFQKGVFGDGISKYKENIDKVIINKMYIISCDK